MTDNNDLLKHILLFSINKKNEKVSYLVIFYLIFIFYRLYSSKNHLQYFYYLLQLLNFMVNLKYFLF